MDKPSPKALVEASGISPSYASMILSDSADPALRRVPPRSLAILIFRKTRWLHPSIEHLSDERMKIFEEEDPWTPPKERQDEAA
jgi:hypothetical protein